MCDIHDQYIKYVIKSKDTQTAYVSPNLGQGFVALK